MIVNHLQKNDFNLYLMHIFSLVQYYFSKSKQTQTTLKAVIFFVGLKATKKEKKKKIIFLVSNCTCNFSSAKRATSVKNAIAYNNLLFYVLLLLIINIDFTNFFVTYSLGSFTVKNQGHHGQMIWVLVVAVT